MCGIAAIFGSDWTAEQLEAMRSVQRHRGPDGEGLYLDPKKLCGLAHNRLSIIDLSDAGSQPMRSSDGRLQIIQNGEIYNYLELRKELEQDYVFRSQSDTEVLLAAFQKWGPQMLDRLIGMFSLVIWDEENKSGFAARDRFGVKPLYYHAGQNNALFVASEIKALHAAGVSKEPNDRVWADYLAFGFTDQSEETFWKGIKQLRGGCFIEWKNDSTKFTKWYDLADRNDFAFDSRSDADVKKEYFDLLQNSVSLRFRADVPVGINLSGGLDSSTLLGLVSLLEKDAESVSAYTFVTGDERYDELPWVSKMLERTGHPLVVSRLDANEVPDLAIDVQKSQDEPFGGLPTLAYAKLFEIAKANGTTVLLDGNGMDEQWAGYDYYASSNGKNAGVVQGMSGSPVRPDCLTTEFRSLAKPLAMNDVFPDKLRNLQYRDIKYTKIPRAMRFNDRISMRSSTELREPFLDHRLFELAFHQPAERKIENGTRKKMLREIARELLPTGVVEAPKRPLQTPQREWLRGELRGWANECIENACRKHGNTWLDANSVRREWERFCRGESDNSFYVWQWISLGLEV
ncbi:MAG: asparagine synthase (glutamine-hydrolyzing) [Blastocatellia bacterium]